MSCASVEMGQEGYASRAGRLTPRMIVQPLSFQIKDVGA